MTFQSIRNYFLVSLLAVQFTNAQTPARVSSSQTLQEQGSQEQKTDRPSGNSESATTEKASIPDPLVNLLVSKGLLTAEDARSILAADPKNQRDRLAALLKDKGVISTAEFDALRVSVPNNPDTIAVAATLARSDAVVNSAPAAPAKQPAPSVIAAIAPLRLLPIDVPTREGLVPNIKLGSGARIKPYGYFKTSVIRDSSSPGGNDFPLPTEIIHQIVTMQLERIRARVRDSYRATFDWTPQLVEAIAARCTESSSGARNVENILARTLLPELSADMLTRLADGQAIQSVKASLNTDGLFFFAIN